MTIKLAIALGVVLGTALPAAAGFDPSAEVCAAPACYKFTNGTTTGPVLTGAAAITDDTKVLLLHVLVVVVVLLLVVVVLVVVVVLLLLLLRLRLLTRHH